MATLWLVLDRPISKKLAQCSGLLLWPPRVKSVCSISCGCFLHGPLVTCPRWQSLLPLFFFLYLALSFYQMGMCMANVRLLDRTNSKNLSQHSELGLWSPQAVRAPAVKKCVQHRRLAFPLFLHGILVKHPKHPVSLPGPKLHKIGTRMATLWLLLESTALWTWAMTA